MSEIYGGFTLDQVHADQTPLSPAEKQILEIVEELMAVEEQSLFDEAYLGGMPLVLDQPEFSHMRRCPGPAGRPRRVQSDPKRCPFDSLAGEGVTRRHRRREPGGRPARLQRAPHSLRRAGRPSGALAVLGPTRMRYSRVIPAVRYLSALMSERVASSC